MWDPCLDCGELNSIVERFCNGCGSGLAERQQAAVSEIRQKISEADQMAEYGRFVDAVALLDSIEFADHSALNELAKQRDDAVASHQQRRESIVQQASAVLESVRAMHAELRFADALAEAEKIPPALRVAELADLHAKAAEKVERAGRLRDQLRAGVREKKYEGLLAVARQLAELDPHDATVRKLLPQLEQWQANADGRRNSQCLREAVAALGQNSYRKAEALLAQVPEVADPELQKTLTAARERVWLANQMAVSPYATKRLVAVSERLVKLQPKDDTAKKLAAQIRERCASGIGSADGRPAAWGKAASQWALGAPVELCPLPPSLVAASRERKAAPAALATAYGLALQAIGEASVSINLMPSDRKGLLGRLGGRPKSKAPLGWGLDIGGQALTAVCLEAPAEPGGAPAVVQLEVCPYGADAAIDPDPREGGLSPAVLEALRGLSERHDLRRTPVVVSLSGPKTLGRFFEIPAPSPSKFEKAVEFEVRSRVPLAPEDIVSDFHAHEMPPSDDPDDLARRWVTLAAASKLQVTKRMQRVTELGWTQLRVAAAPLAVLNTLLSVGGPWADRAGLAEGAALLDVGGSSTNIVVASDSKIWFRGVHFGADSMVTQIAKHLKVDKGTAGKLFRSPESAPAMHLVHEAISPALNELLEQAQRSLELCRADTGIRPERILVTGSASDALGLLPRLRIER